MTVYLVPGVFGAGGQMLDQNGRSVTGALINTYAAGTSSPTSVFTTAAGNVTASNPVQCAADGRLPYELWQPGGVAIKIVVTDSVSNAIGTYDNLTGINDPTALLATSNTWTQQQTFGPIIFLSPISVSSLTVSTLTLSSLSVSSLSVTGQAAFVSNVSISGNLAVTGSVNAGPISSTSLTVSSITISGFQVGSMLISSGSVTLVSTIDISFSGLAAFKNKLVVLSDYAPTTDNTNILMRTSTDNGVTFIATGSYDYGNGGLDPANAGFSGTTAFNATSLNLTNFGSAMALPAIGNASPEGCNIAIKITDPYLSTKRPMYRWEGFFLDTATLPCTFSGGGQLKVTGLSTTAVRFLPSAGSISSCSFSVFVFNGT